MEELKGYRLSAQQRRVWRLRRVDGEEGLAYASTCVVTVEGCVDRRALRRALEAVVERHESLRTRCATLRGMEWPLQVIESAQGLEWREENAGTVDVGTWLARVWSAPCGDTLEAAFGVTAEDRAWLALRISAVYADGWSLQRVVEEMASRYEASIAGREDPLSEEPLQYAQFCEWQHELLMGEEGRDAQQFWARQWDQARQTNALLPLASAGAFRVARLQRIVPDVVVPLCTLEREHGVDAKTVLGSIGDLLRALRREPLMWTGYVADRRQLSELQSMVGNVSSAFPLVCDASEGATVQQLVQMAATGLEVQREWQEYFDWPEALAETYWAEGFEYQELGEAIVAGGVRFEVQAVRSGGERYARKLIVVRQADALRVEVEYDPAVHAADEIARVLEQYETLLRAAVRTPQAVVATLPWVPAEQRREVVETWNQTALAGVPEGTLVDMVEAQCQRTPEVIAVRDDTTTLTYAALASRATALAERLRAAGVGIEARVMVWLERSAAQVVVVLGVWKAGGAYVPVETTLPDARLQAVLADSGARVVVSDGPAPWAVASGAVVVPIEDATQDAAADDAQLAHAARPAWPALPAQPTLHAGLQPQHLAYVIYTSGSTGRPKGVMVPHSAVGNLAAALAATVYADVNAGACVSVNAPLSFDASVKQLVQLASGRTVQVIPETVRRDGEALWRYLQAHDVAIADCTPTQLRLGLMAGVRAGVPRVLVGGEAIDADLWTQLASDRETQYWNVYGPTECTVDATATLVAGPTSHIGRPLGNMRAYIMDPRQQPVPVGVWGELYIGGAGVARGYLGRPALTAARFIPDPFGGHAHAGARLYRTGDWARWRGDGCLEYGGRRDQQVKVRGYRIELGEIEAVLQEHPAVPQAAVVVHGRGDREQLVAFWRSARPAATGRDAAPEVGASALRDWVEQRLPPYMVPAMFVRLERWPMTPNGKVDRAALARMEIAAAAAEAPSEPATPFEELLVSVWQEVLGRAVGVEENFFERGGHSLLATQVIGRVRQTIQREIPLRLLFEAPTVRALAAQLEPLLRGSQQPAPPLVPVPRDGALPLSFVQQRLWFLAQLEPTSTAYNSTKVMRLRGALDVPALEAALQELVQRHEVLRTRFPVRGDAPVQEITLATINFEVQEAPADVDGDADGDAALDSMLRSWVRAARAERFDLAEGPLLRARLLRVAADHHVLLLAMHHIVVDAWSLGVLWRELGQLYASHRAGRPSSLPPLAVQYADFAHWQRQWLQGDVLEEQLAYWRGQLAGVPELKLPTDRARPVQFTGQGDRVSFTLGTELTAQLKAISRAEGVTLFMTLLAGFQVLLGRYARQELFGIGTPIAGRTRPEVEPLIGCFINMLALRTDLRGTPTFRQLLGRVRETCLGAYAHQDLPFERLIDELQLTRNLSRAPLSEVTFGLQNVPRAPLTLADVAVEPLSMTTATSRHDLTLWATDAIEQIHLRFTYRPQVFSEDAIERLASEFPALLTQAASAPDTPLPLLFSASEREQTRERVQNKETHLNDGLARMRHRLSNVS